MQSGRITIQESWVGQRNYRQFSIEGGGCKEDARISSEAGAASFSPDKLIQLLLPYGSLVLTSLLVRGGLGLY